MGKRYIIGCDEVGTGSLAGPALVCCVMVPVGWKVPGGLRDSKKMSAKLRGKMATWLERDAAVRSKKHYLTVKQMDVSSVHVLCASAMIKLIHLVGRHRWDRIDRIIVDGTYRIKPIHGIEVEAITKADDKFPAVSAASVIAKVTRDHRMCGLGALHPEYEFARNKGYGSAAHRDAIKEHGAIPGVHRTKNGVLWGS